MGIDSDGILYFGFTVGDEDEPPEFMDGFEDFDSFIEAKAGLTDDSPYEQRKAAREACPAELYQYCSWEYPMYILGVRGAEYCACRGDAIEIGAKELWVDQDKIDAFRAWCQDNGIEWQEPKWLLCSMYG